MENVKMISHMFKLQNELNEKIRGKDWKDQNLTWHRAIWTECAELLESLNWKWWKNEPIDMINVHIELVDIWHFTMAKILQNYDWSTNKYIDKVVDLLDEVIDFKEYKDINPKETIEKIVYNCVKPTGITHADLIYEFFRLCYHFDLPIDKLYNLYIGKQILNRFRQDNGYGQGTYKKKWNNKEDNIYMYEFSKEYKGIPETFENDLTDFMNKTYKHYLYEEN